jgi:class 3 adenylate cyclase/HAMP domain-containing protein
MKIEPRFLRSKVGRRIVLLFILCALLPIGGLAVVSFTQVTKQLNEQSRQRLRDASKSKGMDIIERLTLLELALRMMAATLDSGSAIPSPLSSQGPNESLELRFERLSVLTDGGESTALLGRAVEFPRNLTEEERQHLATGQSLLIGSPSDDDLPLGMVMIQALDPSNLSQGSLVAEINTEYLWGLEGLSPLTELSVVDASNRTLFCSTGSTDPFLPQLTQEKDRSSTGHFEWQDQDREYMASYWSVFLKFRFFAPPWTVVMSESRADVLAPLADFQRMFPLVILMSFWVVLLLSLVQIRRSLIPLGKLQEGTRRIAQRDFDSRVTVTSGDEFQELATSFNTMATRLGQQFNTLTMVNEIDRAILSALDTERVAGALLSRMHEILPCDSVSVTFLNVNGTQVARTYVAKALGAKQVVNSELTSQEIQTLHSHPKSVIIPVDTHLPHYLSPLAEQGMKSISVLPIFVKDQLSGVISLGHLVASDHSEEDLSYGRQVADQVAVALTNAGLVKEQRELISLFERYVSPEVAAEIVNRQGEIVLAGQEMQATVVFTDIRNFTRMTAGKPSAEVLSWLNNYFTAMSQIILKNDGFLNKFMGDGLLVLFGVPLGETAAMSACKAVQAAVEMLDRVKKMNTENEPGQPELRIGIGLHTGTLTAGNLGARERMEYSVIGETVNLASRLEELTKKFKTGMVMSSETQELIQDRFSTTCLGEVSIRGFPGKSRVYTVEPDQEGIQ